MKIYLCGLLLILHPVRADPASAAICPEGLRAAAMLSRLPDPPILPVFEIAALAQPTPRSRAPIPALPPSILAEAPIVIMPGADGVLDASSVVSVEEPDKIPNPFRVRYHPAPPLREVRLTIDSVLIGSRSEQTAAIINGRLYSPGETLEGLPIAAISADAVDLRENRLLLRMPVQDQPVTLRLP